jgi:hypothetical protein
MEEDKNKLAIWQARAIGTGGNIDIPPDRQAWTGRGYIPFGDWLFGTAEDRKILRTWVKDEALPMVIKWWKENHWDQDAKLDYTSPDGRFNITADPRRSYGYVYITANYYDEVE